jgi:hypothetical protein
MAIKVIRAREMRDRFEFVLHLDDSKTVAEGSNTVPDPRWVLRRTWAKNIVPGERNAYLQAIREELRNEAIERIAQLTDEESDGTPLAIEGQTITP